MFKVKYDGCGCAFLLLFGVCCLVFVWLVYELAVVFS